MELKICVRCDEKFKPSSRHKLCPKCRSENRKKKLCSCGAVIQKSSNNCVSCATSGSNNPAWRGGKTYHKAGYVMVNVGGKYIFEHRLIMQEFLGRELLSTENVHHKNGIKTDNSIDNLELWVKPQPSGQRVSDLIEFAKYVLETYGDDPTKFGGAAGIREPGPRSDRR